MVANVPKWYEMHQNMSLGSNGVDRVGSLRKILTRLRGTNFCTSSARFAPSLKVSLARGRQDRGTRPCRNARKPCVANARALRYNLGFPDGDSDGVGPAPLSQFLSHTRSDGLRERTHKFTLKHCTLY